VWLRYVLVPGWTDNLADIEKLARYAHGLGNIERVDVLPFHQMGKFKWAELGLTYSLADTEPPEPELTNAVRDIFRANGFADCTR
jgi:pyruvate formate lyase activating enzyme